MTAPTSVAQLASTQHSESQQASLSPSERQLAFLNELESEMKMKRAHQKKN